MDKLRAEIESLRRKGGVRASDLESLAQSLGRIRHHRGKEPTWISVVFPRALPISIPGHRRDLNRHTARSILDCLEEDLDRYEMEAHDDE